MKVLLAKKTTSLKLRFILFEKSPHINSSMAFLLPSLASIWKLGRAAATNTETNTVTLSL
jgi:hypothetical protein